MFPGGGGCGGVCPRKQTDCVLYKHTRMNQIKTTVCLKGGGSLREIERNGLTYFNMISLEWSVKGGGRL